MIITGKKDYKHREGWDFLWRGKRGSNLSELATWMSLCCVTAALLGPVLLCNPKPPLGRQWQHRFHLILFSFFFSLSLSLFTEGLMQTHGKRMALEAVRRQESGGKSGERDKDIVWPRCPLFNGCIDLSLILTAVSSSWTCFADWGFRGEVHVTPTRPALVHPWCETCDRQTGHLTSCHFYLCAYL